MFLDAFDEFVHEFYVVVEVEFSGFECFFFVLDVVGEFDGFLLLDVDVHL